jgi:hypothetical protein
MNMSLPPEAADQVSLMLRLMHSVGTRLSESGGANHQAWGHHLLEDWRTLDLLATKLAEQTLREGISDRLMDGSVAR